MCIRDSEFTITTTTTTTTTAAAAAAGGERKRKRASVSTRRWETQSRPKAAAYGGSNGEQVVQCVAAAS
eukprot:11200837-Prorocentrum_lima.AAC.1